jgi:hypothetical protein
MRVTVTANRVEVPADFKQSISDAINETANEAREKAIDIVTQKYNVSHQAVRQKTKLTPARPDNLIAYLGWKGKRMPIAQFSPSQTSVGVVAEIERGKRKIFPHAFIPFPLRGKKLSGVKKENVFIRIEAMRQSGMKSVSPRRKHHPLPANQQKHGYPISVISGISIPDMLKNSQVKSKIIEFIAQFLPKALERNLKIKGNK